MSVYNFYNTLNNIVLNQYGGTHYNGEILDINEKIQNLAKNSKLINDNSSNPEDKIIHSSLKTQISDFLVEGLKNSDKIKYVWRDNQHGILIKDDDGNEHLIENFKG